MWRVAALATIVMGCGQAPAGTPPVQPPACSAPGSASATLSRPVPSFLHLPGQPFGVSVSQDGQRAIVSLTAPDGSGMLALVHVSPGSPKLERTVPLPAAGPGLGLAASHDGRLLAVMNGSGALVFDAPALLAASPAAFLGELQDGTSGAIEAAFSADDRVLFVTDERSGRLSVYDIGVALRLGFQHPGVVVGQVKLSPFPVGVAVSPDGRVLYAVTETSRNAGNRQGTLWTLDVDQAARDPERSVVSAVDAGCTPVRVAPSPDSSTVWVTARGANALLGFDAAALRDAPSRSLRAVARIGPEPVGLTLLEGGRLALVADSDRFGPPTTRQTLSLIDTRAALAGRHALLGYLPAGAFPRELAVDARSKQVFVTNFNSDELETLPTAGLPS